MTELVISSHPRDQYVPMSLFGKDHWSTLGYIETRMVDHGGYMIACDARMRTLAHNHRIFSYRPTDNLQKQGCSLAMLGKRGDGPDNDNVKNGSFLNDGSRLPKHDDWDCIQDLAAAGLLIGDATDVPLRYLDEKSLDSDVGKIIAADDRAARIKIAEFVREQTDFGLDVGARLYFTAEGFKCAAALRKHKATGGHFHYFRWPNP
jgi:hypothetical protein